MSTYFVVHLQTAGAPEGLAEAHAADAVFLNTRGRPCGESRAARLESEGLAQALLEACREPLAVRHGDDLVMAVQGASDPGEEAAERIARDSDATREWLSSQPVT